MWYTYIKQLQIFYWICKMFVYVNNYNIVFISRYKWYILIKIYSLTITIITITYKI